MRSNGNAAPLMIGAVLLGGLLLIVGLVIPLRGDSQDFQDLARAQDTADEPLRKGGTGDPIACRSENLLSSYTQESEGFVLVGTFLDVTDGGIAVAGPTGREDISLDREPHVEDDFYGGEAIRISGLLGPDGELEATEIRIACAEALVREIEIEEPPTAAPPPVQTSNEPLTDDADSPPPAAFDDDGDEKDEKDEKDSRSRGEGNSGRGEGRGNNGGDDGDDDDD